MKRILIYTILTLLFIPALLAQNEVDVLRYSRMYYKGSARFLSMGGAFGSLGGDFSTLSTNPAGIAVYRTSEVIVTPLVFVGSTNSTYNGNKNEDSKSSFSLGNIGMIITTPFGAKATESGWKHFQFGFGVNRLNDFSNRMIITGFNGETSLLDSYVQYSNGTTPNNLNEFDTRPAFDTWLIDTLPGTTNQYNSAIPNGNIEQQRFNTSWGSMNEFVISMGTNYNDVFYFGGTFGFPWIRYFEENTYREFDEQNLVDDFDEFVRRENLDVRGSGFVFKGGVIFRPFNFLRIGAAVHTPITYRITEEYSTNTTSYFDNGDSYEANSPVLLNEYELQTPIHLIGSASLIVGRFLIISADYEYVDYSEGKLRPRNSSYQYYNENDAVRSSYTQTHNLRAGAEIRIRHISLRGGGAYHSSPYREEINDGSKFSVAAGLGYRDKNFIADFAYSASRTEEEYYLYDKSLVNPTYNEIWGHELIMTFGFKF